jgi:fatty acid desaturase
MTYHDPDFLYTWQQGSPERRTGAPEGYEGQLAGIAWQETASEAEALRRWLADGGDLDSAFLYGLHIIVDEEKESMPRRLHAENGGHSVVFTRKLLMKKQQSLSLALPTREVLSPAFPGSAPEASGSLYAELKQSVKSKGLLDKQPVYYTYRIALLAGSLIIGVSVLLFVHLFWLQLLNAVYLAIVSTQIGLLSHEAGHRQMFHHSWKHDLVGLVGGNLLLGMSYAWWVDKHNAHHRRPNQVGLDPDLTVPFLDLTASDDFAQMGSVQRFVRKYLAILFFPALMSVSLGLQASSFSFLWRKQPRYLVLEWFLLLAHAVGYLTFIIWCIGFWQALLFIGLHQALIGLYLGSIFAPNHKGMPILEQENAWDFLHRQVLTARNVRAHPWTDFWYGGLNYQIEHHLFPSMARNHLKEAQSVVRAFCQAHAIPYHETTSWRSFAEILSYLHQMGTPLRGASISVSSVRPEEN